MKRIWRWLFRDSGSERDDEAIAKANCAPLASGVLVDPMRPSGS